MTDEDYFATRSSKDLIADMLESLFDVLADKIDDENRDYFMKCLTELQHRKESPCPTP